MKTKQLLPVVIMLLALSSKLSSQEITAKNGEEQQSIPAIQCTPDLYQLSSNWASVYNSRNPESKIRIENVAENKTGSGMGETISIIKAGNTDELTNEKNWKIVVGRNVIVPVINTENPFMSDILLRGVSSKRFSQFFNNPDKEFWGTLLPGQQKAPVHIYMVNDESVKTAVAEFLGTKNLPLTGISFVTKEEIVSAVKLDPYAVGFCNLVDVLDVDTRSLAENIRLLPVDKNSNGTIDYMEDIYSDANTFLRGVWIGKYPKTLYNNIYAVSKVQPVNEAELSYLKWILNDGQQYLNKNGYCDLAGSESQSQLDKINTTVVSIPTTTAKSSVVGILLLILGIVISVGVITFKIIRAYRNQESIIPDFNIQSAGFDENTVAVPAGLYFDKTHTWAFMEKDGDVTIGLDDFLQHITGPINRIVMKNQGERIKKGDLLFTIIQNGKQLNLYSPVSGIIRKQNDLLTKDSSYLNTAPYSEGWVYQIEPGNWHKEIQFMDMAMQYRKWLNTEFSRVKDFLAATLKPDSLQYSHVVLQDGGVLKEGILNDFGPEVWDDFQTNFLDIYK